MTIASNDGTQSIQARPQGRRVKAGLAAVALTLTTLVVGLGWAPAADAAPSTDTIESYLLREAMDCIRLAEGIGRAQNGSLPSWFFIVNPDCADREIVRFMRNYPHIVSWRWIENGSVLRYWVNG